MTSFARRAAALLALAIAASACGAADEVSTADLSGVVRDQPLDVSDVVLPHADSGEPTPLRAEPGGLSLVFFGFLNCPDICPTTMADVGGALQDLDGAERVQVRFVTVDPERDEPELIEDYLAFFFENADGLRTEDMDELRAAEEAFLASSRIVTTDDGAIDVEHTATVFVVDDRGQVVVEWAFGTSSDAMHHDLATLLRASEDR